MDKLVTGIAMGALASSIGATTVNFDEHRAGLLPDDWIAGVTGQGLPRWTVEADASAPSAPNVLKQSGKGDFPWCVKKGVSLADGTVPVPSVYGRKQTA